jgi:hypothetical protein
MHPPPLYTSWLITCPSPEGAQALRSWLAGRIDPDRVWTDTISSSPNGVPHLQTERHRLGDYFADVLLLPAPTPSPSSFRLVFHRRPEAGRYWKDLMVNVLQEIEAAPQPASITLDGKGDQAPVSPA